MSDGFVEFFVFVGKFVDVFVFNIFDLLILYFLCVICDFEIDFLGFFKFVFVK